MSDTPENTTETENPPNLDLKEFAEEPKEINVPLEEEYESLGQGGDISAVYGVPVQVSAVLGRATMPVSQLLKLGRGAVIELDRRVGESIEVCVNNRVVARGEVVIVDQRLGITMTEIIKAE